MFHLYLLEYKIHRDSSSTSSTPIWNTIAGIYSIPKATDAALSTNIKMFLSFVCIVYVGTLFRCLCCRKVYQTIATLRLFKYWMDLYMSLVTYGTATYIYTLWVASYGSHYIHMHINYILQRKKQFLLGFKHAGRCFPIAECCTATAKLRGICAVRPKIQIKG